MSQNEQNDPVNTPAPTPPPQEPAAQKKGISLLKLLAFAFGTMIGIVVVEEDGPPAVSYIVTKTTKENVTFTVKKTESVAGRHESEPRLYLVWVKHSNGQEETLQNSDTLWEGKFNSSDVHGQLETGKTYNATVAGFRIQVLSAYRNILSVTPVTNAPAATVSTNKPALN